MIRPPLGLRIDPQPGRSPREQVRDAARWGARGVVLDAAGDLHPDRLSETGRRDLRSLLRSVELSPIALNLPIRRAFDTLADLDDRVARADRAFALAYEVGARVVLARVGSTPPESEPDRLAAWLHSLSELGLRADHRGVRLAIEAGSEPADALRAALDRLGSPGLAASLDPGLAARHDLDPAASASTLGPWLSHAYATDAGGPGPMPSPRLSVLRGGPGSRGDLDWPAYLAALEEVEYRGFLTAWPRTGDPAGEFRDLSERLARL